MRTLIATSILATLEALGPAWPAAAAAPPEPPAFAPGELLVRFDGGRERLVELPQGVAVGDAARALREKGTPPPGARDAGAYCVRGVSVVVPDDVNWIDSVRDAMTVPPMIQPRA